MPVLMLNGRGCPFEWILNLPESIAQPSLTPYELNTLRFCQQWLAGQAEFCLRTSGSTGAPKAIVLTRAQMVASARLTGKALDLRQGDRALVCLSTEYIAGIMMLVRGFELELSLTVITPARNPLAMLPAEAVFEFIAFTPLQLREALASTPDPLSLLNKMRAILIGGAPVDQSLLDAIKKLNAPVYHTYGMTETVSHIALKRLNGPQASEYFIPLEGVQLGLSPQGCLTVSSILTEGRTLVTNDLVELRSDGLFRWLGRIDNVINTGGIKVQAEKVEIALARLFSTYQNRLLAGHRFFVGPLVNPELGQAVVAVIEGRPVSQEVQADIQAQLLRIGLLTKYEIPRYFYFLPKFLETPTGKVDRQACLTGLPLQ